MRGPKPKPEAVKAQRAPVRSKRSPKVQVESAPVESGGLKAPDWLDGEALAEWSRLAPALQGAKLLTSPDVTAFARYCRNLARWLKMQKALDDGEIYTVTTQSGTVHRPRPEFLIADRLERQLLAAEDRFGLNPAERQRIMAARAQTGVSGDLFAPAPEKAKREGDIATPAAKPAQPIGSPIGMLN